MDTVQGGKPDDIVLTKVLQENVDIISAYFRDNATLIKREIESRSFPGMKYCLLYTDGMVDNRLVNEDIIRPLLEFKCSPHTADIMDVIAKQVTLSNSTEKTSNIDDILQAILYGDSVLLAENTSEVLILNTKGWITRSIIEPEGEKVLKGPREGFNEALMVNLTLLRRRLRTPDLKMKFKVFGTRTKTRACICYLDSIVNKDVLAELEKRLNTFSIDGTLDVNYITEFITDTRHSPVKTVGSTERPDIVAAKLLEGRVALILDGTPVVLTLPHLFVEHFQSDEDYYLNYFFTSFNRIIRYTAFFISTSIPAIYLSLVTYHQEMIPTPLITGIAMARLNVPFPSVVELVLMLLVFEMLRESGARMPGMMGQALSIVGALVIGQAAVQAKLVSATVIIIVALTGITGLMVPHVKGFALLLRFSFVALSSFLGLYGFLFGSLAALIYLFSVNSFGIPIMTGSYALSQQDKKDIFYRAPWWSMRKRPKLLSPNHTRQSSEGNTH